MDAAHSGEDRGGELGGEGEQRGGAVFPGLEAAVTTSDDKRGACAIEKGCETDHTVTTGSIPSPTLTPTDGGRTPGTPAPRPVGPGADGPAGPGCWGGSGGFNTSADVGRPRQHRHHRAHHSEDQRRPADPRRLHCRPQPTPAPPGLTRRTPGWGGRGIQPRPPHRSSSITSIAKLLGVSPGTLYTHIPDLQELRAAGRVPKGAESSIDIPLDTVN